MKQAIFTGLSGPGRIELLKLHRLIEFQKVFDAYLAGRASSSQVKARAEKLLAVGLPRLK